MGMALGHPHTAQKCGLEETNRAIDTLLCPRSVVVIGATDDPRRMNGAPIRNLLDFGFSGRIHLIADKFSSIAGIPCTKDLQSIADPIDTAIIAVRTDLALHWLGECAAAKISSATIIGAGFEGEDAAAREAARKLHEIVAETGIRLLGPNTAGLINLKDGYVPRAALNHFDPANSKSGNVAIICQSGAISNTIYNKCQANGVGVGYCIATGDQFDLNLPDFIGYAAEDKSIQIIMCVLEGFHDMAKLAAAFNRARVNGKPVILLKLGNSVLGARMVSTHSGSIAGPARVFQAFCRQAGVIEAEDFEQFWEIAAVLKQASRSKPQRSGIGVGVVALSGGDAAFIADTAEQVRVHLPDTSAAFKDFVSSNLRFATSSNPFDPTGEILGNPDLLEKAVNSFVLEHAFDSILISLPVLRSEIALRLLPALQKSLNNHPDQGFILSMWGAGRLTEEALGLLKASGLPVFDNSRRALAAIGKSVLPTKTGNASRFNGLLRLLYVARAAQSRNQNPFYLDLRRQLEECGIQFAPAIRISNPHEVEELNEAAIKTRVLKLNCRNDVHKAAQGYVALGLTSKQEIISAIRAMSVVHEHDGWVLEEQMRADFEIIIGGSTDPELGKIVILGVGGRLVEAFEAPSIWIGEATEDDLRTWIRSSAPARILSGSNQLKTLESLENCVMQIVRWFYQATDVGSFDLNPVMIDLARREAIAVDCRAA